MKKLLFSLIIMSMSGCSDLPQRYFYSPEYSQRSYFRTADPMLMSYFLPNIPITQYTQIGDKTALSQTFGLPDGQLMLQSMSREKSMWVERNGN